MSNAFAIDNFGIKIQETTVNLEILKLLALGQKVIIRSLMKFIPATSRSHAFKELGMENFSKDGLK